LKTGLLGWLRFSTKPNVEQKEENMRITSLIVALVTTAALPVLGQEGVGQEIKHGTKKAGETIKDGVETVGEKTKETAKTVGKKTKETGATVARKTRETVEGTGEKTTHSSRNTDRKSTRTSTKAATETEEPPSANRDSAPAPSPGSR
jgi:hypothetical protein